MSNSYATGSTVGANLEVGGLVGQNQGSVIDSYAVESVKGSWRCRRPRGVQRGISRRTIGLTYAAGEVSGSGSYVGGLVGQNTGNVAESYWDLTTSGQSTSAGTGATGLDYDADGCRRQQNFSTGFDFTSTPGASGNNWVIVDLYGHLK